MRLGLNLGATSLASIALFSRFLRGDTPLRPEWLELQPERLQLLQSSGDLSIPSKEGRAGPKNSQPFSKTNRRCFATDITDDEQNIETRDVETVKLAEHDETRHL
jgi:hypothetical protein